MNRLLTAVILITALAAPVHAQKPGELTSSHVTATGIVLDAQSGSPVTGALVEFPQLRRRTTSDLHGRFWLSGIRPGRHKVVVNQLGFQTLVREVEIEAGVPLTLTLEPDPVLLKAIEVQNDRLANRRQAAAMSVQVFGRDAVLSSAAFTAADFVTTRMNMLPCTTRRDGRTSCIFRRGQYVQPVVYIDERRAFGIEELNSYPMHDIYLIESYDRGRMIRVYTSWFIQNLARRNLPLPNLIVW